MLPPNIQGQEPDPKIAQAHQVIDQLHQAVQKGGEELQALQVKLLKSETDNANEAKTLEIKAFEAETNRMKAMAPQGLMPTAQELAPILAQSLQLIGMGPGALTGGAPGAEPDGDEATPPAVDPGAAPQLPPAAADAAPDQPPLPPAAADAVGPDGDEQPPAAKP
jgi:hypothetical protein